jgi:hypothetical protein
LRISGTSNRQASARIAVAVSSPRSAQTENPPSSASSHANRVSSQPSPARPTVTHERGKPTVIRRKAGRNAQSVASRNRTNAVVTWPSSQPLSWKPKNSSPKVTHGKNARMKKSSVAPARR